MLYNQPMCLQVLIVFFELLVFYVIDKSWVSGCRYEEASHEATLATQAGREDFSDLVAEVHHMSMLVCLCILYLRVFHISFGFILCCSGFYWSNGSSSVAVLYSPFNFDEYHCSSFRWRRSGNARHKRKMAKQRSKRISSFRPARISRFFCCFDPGGLVLGSMGAICTI
jgi:hypothetical protein